MHNCSRFHYWARGQYRRDLNPILGRSSRGAALVDKHRAVVFVCVCYRRQNELQYEMRTGGVSRILATRSLVLHIRNPNGPQLHHYILSLERTIIIWHSSPNLELPRRGTKLWRR